MLILNAKTNFILNLQKVNQYRNVLKHFVRPVTFLFEIILQIIENNWLEMDKSIYYILLHQN